METSKRLSQAVSVIPVIVSLLVLYMSGTLGSWFIVEEFYQYSATDEDADKLIDFSDYTYYLDEVKIVDYTDTSREDSYEVIMPYSTSEGYEQRSTVFYNIGLVFYAIMILIILSSIFVFVLDYGWDEIKKSEFGRIISKNEFLAVIFGGYIAIIAFVLFLALYSISAIPNGMYVDHYGTDKACLYQEDITIIGNVDGCEGKAGGERAVLQSVWTIGPGFIIFVLGVLGPSTFLLSNIYQRFEASEEQSSLETELYFDPEAQILFDINTGEVVASFVGEERDFFFDEDAVLLFDEGSGEILYSPDID